jgi:hypothetical protein
LAQSSDEKPLPYKAFQGKKHPKKDTIKIIDSEKISQQQHQTDIVKGIRMAIKKFRFAKQPQQ